MTFVFLDGLGGGRRVGLRCGLAGVVLAGVFMAGGGRGGVWLVCSWLVFAGVTGVCLAGVFLRVFGGGGWCSWPVVGGWGWGGVFRKPLSISALAQSHAFLAMQAYPLTT